MTNRGRTVALQAGLLAMLAGLVLLALLLLRDGDVAAPSTVPEPEPPNALVWESEFFNDFRMVSEQPSSCGDAATADTYGVPMVLRIFAYTGQVTLEKTVLLGLEAMPYEYVPAQVGVGSYDPSPAGWEVGGRASLGFRSGPIGRVPTEQFLRRLDQPALLFRYSAGFCDQEDGSPLPGGRVFGSTIRLPADLPEIIVHEEGDYLSAQEAMKIVTSRLPAGVRPVRATLDRVSRVFGGSSTPDPVVWSIMLAAGDALGPKRLGEEYGMTYLIDASTGRQTGQSCCFYLVFNK